MGHKRRLQDIRKAILSVQDILFVKEELQIFSLSSFIILTIMRKKKHISDLPKEAKMVYELLSKIN